MAPLSRRASIGALLAFASVFAPAAAKEPVRLRALTINVAGIPFVHPRIGDRMAGLGRAFAAGGFDIIALQEAWRDSDVLRLAGMSGLLHAARPRSVFPVASGLSILSRWPIILQEEREFSALRPSLLNVTQGEPFCRKGMLFARVATPWGELDVYDAHTISDYPDTLYEALRLMQLFELSEFVLERSAGRPFVILADLNTGHGRRDFGLFMDLLGARDACREGNKESCDEAKWDGQRIDFILLPPGGPGAGARPELGGDLPGFKPSTPYSDHTGYAVDLLPAHLRLKPAPDPRRRAAALHEIDATLSRMIDRMRSRARARSWIPLYGAAVAARYANQTRALNALRERARSALRPR